MDERDAAATLKRKRETDEEASDGGVGTELPLAVQPKEKKSKRRKVEVGDKVAADVATKPDSKDTEDEKRRRKTDQKAAKRERKQARQAKLKEKKDKLKQKKKDSKLDTEKPKKQRPAKQDQTTKDDQSDESSSDDEEEAEAIEIDAAVAKSFSAVDEGHARSTASPSPPPESVLSPQIHSGTSSISSIQAPSVTGNVQKSTKPADPVPSEPTAEEKSAAKERLATRLSELRAARKADDPEKKPGSRQELLDQRRRKEEAAKKAKKEQWRKEKEDELRKQEAEIAKRFSPGGSGSLLASPRSPMVEDSNFSFGRVAFGDGTQADATLSGLLDPKRRKGPTDAGTALLAAQNKAKRVSGYDPDKRKEIEEKDMWLNAKKKAHGERVRDDTSLLKKALKRQEGVKKKSEKEWTDRIEGVQKGQEIRQKKREGNLQKRKDEKGGKGKVKAKKVKRPGFEGSFRGRTGGGKKK
jgi:hypothetical protein